MFLCCLCLLPLAAGFLDFESITKVVAKNIKAAWKFINDIPGNKLTTQRDNKLEIQEKLHSIFGQLSAVEGRFQAPQDEIFRIIDNLPSEVKERMKLGQLLETIRQIQRVEAEFEGYKLLGLSDQFNSTNEKMFENETITKLWDATISDQPGSLLTNAAALYQMVVSYDPETSHPRSGLFSSLQEYYKENDMNICEVKMSLRQVLSYLFTILQMTQLKAYTMIHFSWFMLRLYSEGNFTKEAEILRTNYLNRMSEQGKDFQESMKRADEGFWRCDPKDHVKDETYTEVTKLMQGVFTKEDLNENKKCSGDCQRTTNPSTKQHGCSKNKFCSDRLTCNGEVIGCKTVDSTMEVCEAADNSTRRYDSITIKNESTSGYTQSCQKPIINLNSKWRRLWNKVVKDCPYCFCYCDDSKDDQSDRYFNLRPVVSDTDNNRVVTGVKFVKVNRIVHLQIQQGGLLPFGRINETTIEWKPVKNFSIDDDGVQKGVDYHMLTFESRAINLDYIKAPSGYLVTGLKLDVVEGHLRLKIEVNKFNFREGKLLPFTNDSKVEKNVKTHFINSTRTHLSLSGLDVPTKSAVPSRIDSKPNQFVNFGPTDLERDVGQSTIPFIDVQEVAPNPAMPLDGIGLYHKGGSNSGGFIGPKVLTYDFSKEIIDNFLKIN